MLLVQVLNSLLEKDPAQRPTAAEALAKLDPLLRKAEEALWSRVFPLPNRVRRWLEGPICELTGIVSHFETEGRERTL